MADPYVRTVGTVEDIDGVEVTVGVDYDTVTFRHARLGAEAAEEFAKLFVRAYREAGANAERMRREASDG